MFEIVNRDKGRYKFKRTIIQNIKHYFFLCLWYLKPITWWRLLFWKLTQNKNFYDREFCYWVCDDKAMVKHLSKSLGKRYIDWDYMIYIHGGGMPNLVLRMKKAAKLNADNFVYFMHKQHEKIMASL